MARSEGRQTADVDMDRILGDVLSIPDDAHDGPIVRSLCALHMTKTILVVIVECIIYFLTTTYKPGAVENSTGSPDMRKADCRFFAVFQRVKICTCKQYEFRRK